MIVHKGGLYKTQEPQDVNYPVMLKRCAWVYETGRMTTYIHICDVKGAAEDLA